MGFGNRGRGGGFRGGSGDRSRGSFRGGRGDGSRGSFREGGRGEGSRGSFREGGRGDGFRGRRGSFGDGNGQRRGFGDNSGPRRGFGDRGRGRGGSRGGRGGGGFRGGSKVFIEPHRHPGVFIARGKDDALVTRNLVVGESVYKEKRISVQDKNSEDKIEYRMWNPFRSKLAAAILGGVENIWIKPGSKVLYLGAASGTTVSHVSDIVGSDGIVYAVEFSHRSGRDLLGVAKKRPNIVPIIEDARYPQRYAMMLSMVDTIFSDIAQPDQSRILALNAQHFLKNGGHYLISIKANCVDSTAEPTAVFADEVKKLTADKLKPQEQITLEPYERDHAVVVGVYRSQNKQNK